jgi:hypothetical protein
MKREAVLGLKVLPAAARVCDLRRLDLVFGCHLPLKMMEVTARRLFGLARPGSGNIKDPDHFLHKLLFEIATQ